MTFSTLQDFKIDRDMTPALEAATSDVSEIVSTRQCFCTDLTLQKTLISIDNFCLNDVNSKDQRFHLLISIIDQRFHSLKLTYSIFVNF